MKKIIIGIILLCGSLSAHANYKNCLVTRVIDGDTIVANCNQKRNLRVRLVGIDSYETRRNNRAYKQAYLTNVSVERIVILGKQASNVTTNLLLNRHVNILVNKKTPVDRYNRTLGTIVLEGVNINNKLLIDYPDLFVKY